MQQIVHIHPKDNVAVAVTALVRGDTISRGDSPLTVAEEIPAGHKIALSEIHSGEDIYKYGWPIGRASTDIPAGHWVHTHNVSTKLGEQTEYSYRPLSGESKRLSDAIHASQDRTTLQTDSELPSTFEGYLREDGRVAIRNEIWILPTVGCVNDLCSQLSLDVCAYAQSVGLDGVYAFTHPFGCSQMGDDHATTRRLLAALTNHPHAGGVLLVGLGCENNHIAGMQAEPGLRKGERIRYLIAQEEMDERASGERLLRELIDLAAKDRRQTLAISSLVVGLKCGGSDGFSGITANPVAGAFSDLLLARGGSTILTEVPEMFGAEQILMDRCVDESTFDKLVRMVNACKNYFTSHDQVIYENPSPGNKAGGITTLEDKSLGCVQKGGTAPVADVIGYGESVAVPGLTLLQGPGNDLVSTTALTAAGAHMILFTTGRGTPFGAPAVTLKISSNSDLARRKPGWVDWDAGGVADGLQVARLADALFRFVVEVADGRRSRAEINGYRSISIWKDGVTV